MASIRFPRGRPSDLGQFRAVRGSKLTKICRVLPPATASHVRLPRPPRLPPPPPMPSDLGHFDADHGSHVRADHRSIETQPVPGSGCGGQRQPLRRRASVQLDRRRHRRARKESFRPPAWPRRAPRPLYDVASALPCGHMHAPKLQLAMKVGGRYNIDAISGRQWRRFAEVNVLDADDTVARIDQLAERAPETFTTVARSESVNELRSQLPARLVEHRGQSRKLPNETPAVAQDRPARTRGPPTRWARGVKWSRRKPLRPAMGVFPWDSHWEHATWLVVSGDNPTTTVHAAAVAGRANRP